MRLALDEPLQQIIDAIKSTLDKTPPELASDIMDRGIVLAGGGALLHRLDERMRHETEMPVHVAESPLTCVAVGSGRSLAYAEKQRCRSTSPSRRSRAWRSAPAEPSRNSTSSSAQAAPRATAGRATEQDRRAHLGQWGGACGRLAVIAWPASSAKTGVGAAAGADVVVVQVLVVSGAEQGQVVELGLAAMLDGDEVVRFELAGGGAARGLAVAEALVQRACCG